MVTFFMLVDFTVLDDMLSEHTNVYS